METSGAALIIATYSAVVATLVGAWNIYQQVIMYRERLDVQVVRGEMIMGGVGTIAKDRLWYKVTNIGRQPIWLHSIGGRYKRGQPQRHFVIATARELPVKLEPGEVFHDTSSDTTKLGPERVRYLCAWDTKNGIHKAPRRQLLELRRLAALPPPEQDDIGT